MDRGTDSINNLLNYILFSILPTIVDIIVAIVFFITAFNAWFGLIVTITMLLYISECAIVAQKTLQLITVASSFNNSNYGMAYKISKTHEFGGQRN